MSIRERADVTDNQIARDIAQSQLLTTHRVIDRDALLQLIATRSTDDYLYADRLLKSFTISDIPIDDGVSNEQPQRTEIDDAEGEIEIDGEVNRTMNQSIANQGFYFDDDEILNSEQDVTSDSALDAPVHNGALSGDVTESCLVQRSLFSSSDDERDAEIQPNAPVPPGTVANGDEFGLIGPDEGDSARLAAQLDSAAVQYRLISSMMTASSMVGSVAGQNPADRCTSIHNPMFDSTGSSACASSSELRTNWRSVATPATRGAAQKIYADEKAINQASEKQWSAWRRFRAAQDQDEASMSASLFIQKPRSAGKSSTTFRLAGEPVIESAQSKVTWQQVAAKRSRASTAQPNVTTTWRDLKAAYQDQPVDSSLSNKPLALRAPKYRYSMTLLELYQRTIERRRDDSQSVGGSTFCQNTVGGLNETEKGTMTNENEKLGPVGWFERLFSQFGSSGSVGAVMTQSTPAPANQFAFGLVPMEEGARTSHSLNGTVGESQSDCSVLVSSTTRADCGVQTNITIPSLRPGDAERMRRFLMAVGKNVSGNVSTSSGANSSSSASPHRASLTITQRLPDLQFLRRGGSPRPAPVRRADAAVAVVSSGLDANASANANAGKSPSITSSSGFSSSCYSNTSDHLLPASSRNRNGVRISNRSASEPEPEAEEESVDDERPTAIETIEELSQSAHEMALASGSVINSCKRSQSPTSNKPRKSVSFNEIIEFHSPSPNPSSSPEQSPSRCSSSQLAYGSNRSAQHGRIRLAMSIPDLVQLQIECPPLEFATCCTNSNFDHSHSPGALRSLRLAATVAMTMLAHEPPLRSRLRVFVSDLLSGVDLIAKHFKLVEMVGFSSHFSDPASAASSPALTLQRKLDRVFLEYFVSAVQQLLIDQLLPTVNATANSCGSLASADESNSSNSDYWPFLVDAFAPSSALSNAVNDVHNSFYAHLEALVTNRSANGNRSGSIRPARSSICSSNGTQIWPDASHQQTMKLILLLARVLNDGLLFDFFDVLFAAATSQVVERHYRAASTIYLLHQLLFVEFELTGICDVDVDATVRDELSSLRDMSVRQLRELFAHLESLCRFEFLLDGDTLIRQFVDEQERLAASGACCSIATSPSNTTLSMQFNRSTGNPSPTGSTGLNVSTSRKASFIPVRVSGSNASLPSPTCPPAQASVQVAAVPPLQPAAVTPAATAAAAVTGRNPVSGASSTRVSSNTRTTQITGAGTRSAQHTNTQRSNQTRTAPTRVATNRNVPAGAMRSDTVTSVRVRPVHQPHSVASKQTVTSTPRSNTSATTTNPTAATNGGSNEIDINANGNVIGDGKQAPSFVQRLYQRMRFTNKK